MKVVVVKRAVSGSTVQVAIIGATCAGLVAARDLARAGRSVRVIDVMRPGAVPLGIGLASAWAGPLGHRIALPHGEQPATTYLSGLAEATQEVRRFAAQHAVASDVAPALGVVVDGHLAFELRHEARLLRLAGMRVDFRDDQPFGVQVRPMLSLADQAWVDFPAYLAALRRSAMDAGVIVTHGTVQRVAPGWLSTSAGEISAVDVLDTVGVIESRSPAVRALQDARRPVVTTGPLRPAAAEHGDGGPSMLAAWMDTPVELLLATDGGATVVGRPEGDLDDLAAWVEDHLSAPTLSRSSVVTEESGDGLPVVGGIPGSDHAWAARGFGLLDVSGGTWGGHQAAAAILTGVAVPAWPGRRLGAAEAAVRRRVGVLADPKQRVAEVLRARALSRDAHGRR